MQAIVAQSDLLLQAALWSPSLSCKQHFWRWVGVDVNWTPPSPNGWCANEEKPNRSRSFFDMCTYCCDATATCRTFFTTAEKPDKSRNSRVATATSSAKPKNLLRLHPKRKGQLQESAAQYRGKWLRAQSGGCIKSPVRWLHPCHIQVV